jgi:hypothetical protein
MNAHTSYPAVLRVEVRRAARLSHAIALFGKRVAPGHPCFVWSLGRVDEVRAVVSAVTSEWSESRLDAPQAALRLHDYVRGLEESLRAYARASQTPSSRPRNDTIVDA